MGWFLIYISVFLRILLTNIVADKSRNNIVDASIHLKKADLEIGVKFLYNGFGQVLYSALCTDSASLDVINITTVRVQPKDDKNLSKRKSNSNTVWVDFVLDISCFANLSVQYHWRYRWENKMFCYHTFTGDLKIDIAVNTIYVPLYMVYCDLSRSPD